MNSKSYATVGTIFIPRKLMRRPAELLFCLPIFSLLVGGPSQSFAATLTRTNFASSITSFSMAAVWVAQSRGLFEKNGLQVQFILMPRAPLAVAALMVGEIDMAVIGPGHLLNAALGGSDTIAIANFFQKLDFQFSGRPEVKAPEDLRGKRVAISGPASTSHIVSLLALQQLRIDPQQARINFITIPGTEVNRRIALETGSADATTLKGAVGDIYARRGYTTLFNFTGSGITVPQTTMVTTRRIAATKPQLVEAYLKSIIEAVAFLLDPANKETVTRLVATQLRLTNPADAEETYQSVVDSFERVPYPHLDGMKRLHGILSSINPKLAELRPETVVDEKPIRDLEKSGFVRKVFGR